MSSKVLGFDAGPDIEHFDLFEENVRIGVIGGKPTILDTGYKQELSKLTPDLQEQVEKATRILKESAFPRRLVTVDSSGTGTSVNIQNGVIQSVNVVSAGSGYINSLSSLMGSIGSSSASMLGGTQMQSPIIYETARKV